MNSVPVSYEIAVSDDQLEQIMSCAVEGGINYWATVRNIVLDGTKESDPHYISFEVADSDEVWEHEYEGTGPEPAWQKVTKEIILKGLQIMMAAKDEDLNGIGMTPKYRASIRDYLVEGNIDELDAGDSDSVLQVGVYGKVVNG